MALGSPALISTLEKWKLVCSEPPLFLFCSLEPVECHFLRYDLTRHVYGTILEETRTAVGRSALSFQAGLGSTVDE